MNKANSLKRIPVFLFVMLLTLDVSVLIFEKLGANASGTALGDELAFSWRLLQNPCIWAVVILSLLQLFVWSKILSKTDLSIAYPVSSLFFPLTMLASVGLFHEHVSWSAWLGGILITAGIAFVGSEKKAESNVEIQTDSPPQKVLASSAAGK